MEYQVRCGENFSDILTLILHSLCALIHPPRTSTLADFRRAFSLEPFLALSTLQIELVVTIVEQVTVMDGFLTLPSRLPSTEPITTSSRSASTCGHHPRGLLEPMTQKAIASLSGHSSPILWLRHMQLASDPFMGASIATCR